MTDPTIPALRRNEAALDFLATRRSRPAKTLGPQGPERDELDALLRLAARTPDHGKLEPWRFVVIAGDARARVAEAVRARGLARGDDAAAADKAAGAFLQGALAVAVVAAPKPSEKIPAEEQRMSAACVCLSLVNACLAAGWGANWLTGWPATDAQALAAIGVAPPERVAGFIHIGAETTVPPERPRPDVAAITTWL